MAEAAFTIAPESPDQYEAIHALHRDAFETPAEADLVDRLRPAAIALSALDRDGTVIGHVVFSKMQSAVPALGLAPVSVAENCRRQGVAAALIRAGLEQAAKGDWRYVFVLGEPDYYSRFGFDASLASTFDGPYPAPYFMALPLGGRTGDGHGRTVAYHAVFDTL